MWADGCGGRAGWPVPRPRPAPYHRPVLSIMLCGASDTDRIQAEFLKVVAEFGGDPWHYQSGRIRHLNSAGASFAANSRRTVQSVNLCVFVIVERYGQLTWETELGEALFSGKPFLIFCLDHTYQKYLTLRSSVDPAAITSPDDRRLVEVIR